MEEGVARGGVFWAREPWCPQERVPAPPPEPRREWGALRRALTETHERVEFGGPRVEGPVHVPKGEGRGEPVGVYGEMRGRQGAKEDCGSVGRPVQEVWNSKKNTLPCRQKRLPVTKKIYNDESQIVYT